MILATVRFTITNFSRFSGILGTARYVITNILGFLAPRHLQSWIFWDYRRREIHNRVPKSAIRHVDDGLSMFSRLVEVEVEYRPSLNGRKYI